MPAVACLSHRQLEDYSLGRLAGAEHRDAESHVASCPDCGEALAAADRASDTLLRSLHSPFEDSDSGPDGAYDRAAAIVKRLAAVPADSAEIASRPPAGNALVTPALAAELTRLRDYRLLRKLGEGGMGTVYKALHVRLDRVFALKVLPPDRVHDAAAVARFEREMRAAGRFDHPAIVRATDAGELDGTHFLVMEYVEGLDLARLAERTGPLPVADACEIIRQAAVGLSHVHERGMIHRDIKPSNLMLAGRKVEGSELRVEGLKAPASDPQPSTIDSQPSIKILDLGLALLGGTHGTACELTTVGQFMGTLDYMAPEQADDSHDVDARADVYSLGATLYRLLTGQAPFAGPDRLSPVKKFKAVLLAPPPDVREQRPEVPPELAAHIARMLAKNPEDRPESAAAVARSLDDFCRGADLAALLARAEQHAPREADGIAGGGPLPPISRHGGDSQGDRRPDEQPSVRRQPAPRRRRLIGVAAAALAALLVAAAVFVIRIQTDKGELIIRSADPDVQVLVKRGGEPVDDLNLQQGENRTTVRSGSYEIVLLGDTDGLTVRNGEFTLTRGGEHIVTVERLARDARESAAQGSQHAEAKPVPLDKATADRPPNAPRYGGVTYEEAKRTLQTERKPEIVAEAVEVIGALADEDMYGEVVRLLLDTARHFGDPVFPPSSESDIARQEIRDVLGRLNSTPAAEALSQTLERGIHRDRLYALEALSRFDKERAAVAMPSLLAASRDADLSIRADAIALLGRFGLDQPQVIERLRSALRDEDLRVVEYAAKALLNLEAIPPGIDDEVNAGLVRLLEGDVTASRALDRMSYAAETLATRNPDAEALVPALITLMRQGWRPSAMMVKSLGPRVVVKAVPDLVELAKSDEFLLKVLAIDVLGEIGPAASEALPVLNGISDGGGALKSNAASAIRKITGSEEPETPDAESAADNKPSKPAPSYGGKTYAEAKRLLQSERKPEIIGEAIEAIGALADQGSHAEALRLILDAARHQGDPWIYGGPGGGDVRLKVVTTLQTHFDSPDGVQAISDALRDGDEWSRPYLLVALGRGAMGQTGGPISIENARHAVPGVLAATQADDPRIASLALTLAAELAPDDQRVRGRLQEALSHEDLDIVWSAALQLAEINPRTAGLREALARLLRLKMERLREPGAAAAAATTAEVLAKVDPAADGLVHALITLIEQSESPEPDWDVRGHALTTLSRLGPHAAAAVPLLLRITQDTTYADRRWPPVLFSGGFTTFGGGGVPEKDSKSLQILAIEALGDIGPAASDALPVLRQLAPDNESEGASHPGEPPLRQAAEKAIQQITRPPAR